MKCEIIRNNEIIAGPIEFEANRVRDIVARQGGDFRLVPNSMTAAIQIGTIAIKPVAYSTPTYSRMEQLGPADRVETDHLVTYTHSIIPRNPEAVRTELMGELKRIHDAHDLGTTVYQGVSIKTDLEARINAEGTLSAFADGRLTATLWRGQAITDPDTGIEGPSKVEVTSTADMQALRDAIFGSLAAGFAAKEQVETLIAAATAEDLETLDVRAQFDAVVAAITNPAPAAE